MDWILSHIEVIGAMVGLMSAVWTLIRRLDKTLKKHLSEEFATKADLALGLAVLERKLDRIIKSTQVDFTKSSHKLRLHDGENQ